MFDAGWAKQEILIQPKGLAMFGYGQWTHRAYHKKTPLFARSICIRQQVQQPWLILCCLDLGCITSAIRLDVITRLKAELAADFSEQALMLTATHTHSGPGGCAFEALYNMPTPGFVPEHVNLIVDAIVGSIQLAIAEAQKTEIKMTQGEFSPQIEVAWNRSISAYNLNPEVIPIADHKTHLALDRNMQLLGFYREQQLHAVFSLFGVHATCLSNQLDAYDADNKGYAAVDLEQRLIQQGVAHPVAIFAQGTAGDVSPHYHGPGQLSKRKKIKGEKEYQYAQQNGLRQSQLALTSLKQNDAESVVGEIDSILNYVNFTHLDVDAEFAAGQISAKTSSPCFGASFFAGTPVDGLGAAKPIILIMKTAADYVRHQRLKRQDPHDIELYKSQGKKQIVLEAGPKRLLGQSLSSVPNHIDKLVTEMNRQYKLGAIKESLLVPEVLPIQLIRLGQVVMICCPGEITTIAGQRLKNTVRQYLNNNTLEVWLCSYCNDYMGYITTQEEYQKQNYEGGHTLYGQWTLAAFQTEYKALVQNFRQPAFQRKKQPDLQPICPPQHELLKRSYID